MALATAVAVLGLPHGACDPALALSLRGRGEGGVLRFVAKFSVGYLGVCLAFWVLWQAAPVAALISFLSLSIWHWGATDASAVPLAHWAPWLLEALSRGAASIAFSACYFRETTAALFAWLIDEPYSLVVRVVSRWALHGALLVTTGLAASAAFHLVGCARSTTRLAHALAILEMATTALLFCTVPPVEAFVVYFCFGHSVRHVLDVAVTADPLNARHAFARLALWAVPFTLATWLLGAIAYVVAFSREGEATQKSVARLVFIGLSCLTAPHMVLVEAWTHATPTLRVLRPTSKASGEESVWLQNVGVRPSPLVHSPSQTE
jgi:Brp/Blh family beta-carotene 15,15'-monooxygenase